MAGASAADVRSILSLPNPTGPMIRKPQLPVERAKKPGNISRELYSLIGPGTPTISAQLSKPRLKQKPNLSGAGKVKWCVQCNIFIKHEYWRERISSTREQQAFKNQARSDSLRLTHWVKAGTDPDAGKARPQHFVRRTHHMWLYIQNILFPNTTSSKLHTCILKTNIRVFFTVSSEYMLYWRRLTRIGYEDPEWTKEETDYLFNLVREYDSRFYIVDDRYEYPGGPKRTLEVCFLLGPMLI